MSLKTRISNFVERVYVSKPVKDAWHSLLLYCLEEFDREARSEERKKHVRAFQQIQIMFADFRHKPTYEKGEKIDTICREAIAPREKK